MTTRDHLFLIQFDRRTNESEVEDLGHDVTLAIDAFRRRERQLADADVEIVLVGSASLETLRKTHGSYFGGGGGLAEALASSGQ